MPLSRAERSKRGGWLEDCTETALKELRADGIRLVYERRHPSDARPDFIVTVLPNGEQFEIELKNWNPKSPQRHYTVKARMEKKWTCEIRILIISSTEETTLTQKASAELSKKPISVIFSLGRAARSSEDREIIEIVKSDIKDTLSWLGWLKKWNKDDR